jgi:hypothetical protein
VQQHDGVALSYLDIRHLAAEDPPPLFLVWKCRGDHVRFSWSSVSMFSDIDAVTEIIGGSALIMADLPDDHLPQVCLCIP